MSLYRRPGSPHWWTEFQVRGTRIQRSTGTASRRDAAVVERRLRDEARSATKAAPVTLAPTLDQSCGRYWIEHGHKLRDARNVARWLRYIVDHGPRDIPMSDLSTKHVTELVAKLQALGIGAIAINRTLAALQGVHNRAGKRWEWPTRVIDWRPHKVKERARIAFLTHEEAKGLLAALPKHIAAVVRFLLLTGLRKREAFGLTWGNVQIAAVVVTVKGGYERRVEIPAEASAILAEQPRSGRYVFDTTNHRPIFKRAAEAIGRPELRWHDLRHTHATWLGQSGASLDIIRDQLGHSSINVTQKYRHVVSAEVRGALDRLPTLGGKSDTIVPMKRKE